MSIRNRESNRQTDLRPTRSCIVISTVGRMCYYIEPSMENWNRELGAKGPLSSVHLYVCPGCQGAVLRTP
jgi:hypothetical protein